VPAAETIQLQGENDVVSNAGFVLNNQDMPLSVLHSDQSLRWVPSSSIM